MIQPALTSTTAILVAAERCFAATSVRKTTIEDVAAAAGVSRITVYRHLGNRDELILKVLLRVTERFLARTRPRTLASSDLAAGITDLILATVSAARRDNSLLLLYASEERGATGGPIPGATAPLVSLFGEVVGDLVERFPGQLRPEITVEAASEWTLRIILSLLTLEPPTPRDDDAVRRYVNTFAVPPLTQTGEPPTHERRDGPEGLR